jgi:predicted nucleic-acid-binding protein
MIGLDTNVLARYYVAATPGVDDAATAKQCEAARALIDSGKRLMVSKSVMLELEWVLRGRYALTARQVQKVLGHLLGLAQVEVEDKVAVRSALTALAQGFDFADALHHASYRSCASVATFDDKGFVRRAKKAGLKPVVQLVG